MIQEDKKIFSERALERLRSPEKMDSLMTIVPPAGWVALVAVVLLVVGAVIWSIFGVIAIKISGFGMIVDAGGVASVESMNSGRVERIAVVKGARVKKGDVLAVLEQPDMENEKIMAGYSIGLAKSNSEAMLSSSQYDLKSQKYNLGRYIISPYDGIVSEIKTDEGAVIAAGASAFAIRRDQERTDMRMVMYVPAVGGKKVKPGMVVQMQPNGIDSSEYGSLLGMVREVSPYPVSSDRMVRVLGNEALAQVALKACDGSAMELNVELIRDPENSSGYLWSSIIDSGIQISPGSTGTGMVIVERKPPISKIFGKISNWLRND